MMYINKNEMQQFD